jgi:hypothetical protein
MVHVEYPFLEYINTPFGPTAIAFNASYTYTEFSEYGAEMSVHEPPLIYVIALVPTTIA